MKFLRTSLQKYAIQIGIFMLVWVCIFFTYSHFHIIVDIDSDSYLYLIKTSKGLHISFPNMFRPPVYPVILWFAWIVKNADFLLNLYTVQAIIMTIVFILIYTITQRLFRQEIISIIICLLCLIHYPSVSLINQMGPDVIIVIEMFMLVYVSFFIPKNPLYMIPVVCILTALSFTKPMFLYFPIALGIFYIFLYLNRYVTGKHICIYGIAIILLYFLPAYAWTRGVYRQYGFSTFSVVREINLIGKLLQYRMLNDGPMLIDHMPVKRWVAENNTLNPYDLIKNIERTYDLTEDKKLKFERALYQYGNILFQNNILKYSWRSIQLLPTVLSSFTDTPKHSFICGNPSLQQDAAYCRNPVFRLVLMVYDFCYIHIINRIFMLMFYVSIITFSVCCMHLVKQTLSAYRYMYMFLFVMVMYFVAFTTFGAYIDYQRLVKPIVFPALLLFCMCIYDIIQSWVDIFRNTTK